MDRREAVRRIGMLVGGALSAPVAAGVLGGCRPETNGRYVPQTLSDEQFALVRHLSEMIIPETDTPGAAASGVDVFIDKMLTRWFEVDDRARFLDGLNVLGPAFADLPAEKQVEELVKLDAEAVSARLSDVEPLPFFALLKEMTLVGYYTSEAGGSQELQYVMTAGRYDGDVALSTVGRAYSRCSPHN